MHGYRAGYRNYRPDCQRGGPPDLFRWLRSERHLLNPPAWHTAAEVAALLLVLYGLFYGAGACLAVLRKVFAAIAPGAAP
jgi:hypothetical protein